MKKSAGAIIRVSTSKQLDGTSPEKQVENILAFAEAQGYEIKSEHIWQNAESGGLRGEQREGFQHSLRAAQSGKISRVYVFSLDRLGRDLIETLVYLRSLTDWGVDCWEAEHRQLLKHDDLVVMILGAVASNERKQILARTEDGLRRSIAAGKYSGGIVAYGYQVNPVTKKLEINEAEAEVVRMIFKWCVEEQLSTSKIADRLNALNIPTHYAKDERMMIRTGKLAPEHTLEVWRQNQVYRMLLNQAYAGHWVYGKRTKRTTKQLIEGFSPTIISDETFQKAQEIVANHNFYNPRNVKQNYLLRGLIRCGICGRNFCGGAPKFRTEGNSAQYYVCIGRRQWRRLGLPEKCENTSIRGRELDEFVWNDVQTFCKHPETAIDQLRMTYKPHDDNLDEKIKEANEKLKELMRQEENILKIAVESKKVNIQVLDTVTDGIRRKQEAIMKHIDALQSAKELSSNLEREIQNALVTLREIADIIDNASFEEKRSAILSIVKRIEVFPTEVKGKLVPYVKIIYRFNEPAPEVPELLLDEIFVTSNHTTAYPGTPLL